MNFLKRFALKEAKKTIEKDYPFLCNNCKLKMIESYAKVNYKIIALYGSVLVVIIIFTIIKIFGG